MIKYLDVHQVASRYGTSRRTVWRWSAQGILPKPVSLTAQSARWLLSELDARDAEREAARTKPAA